MSFRLPLSIPKSSSAFSSISPSALSSNSAPFRRFRNVSTSTGPGNWASSSLRHRPLRPSLVLPQRSFSTRSRSQFGMLESTTDSGSHPPTTAPAAPATASKTQASGTASSSPLYEWIVIIPDHEDAREKRIAIRPQHLAGLKPTLESGFCAMGGAFFSHHPAPAGDGGVEDDAPVSPPAMLGSILLARARSKEELLEELRKDIYHHERVWNLDKVIIYPFKCAVRTPM